MPPEHKTITLIGDACCGKTSIINRFVNKNAPRVYSPTIVDNYAAEVLVRKRFKKFTVWDSAGQEEYPHIRRLTYRNASLILIVFDLSNKYSLENVFLIWYPEVQENCPNVPLILVGNKTDLRSNGARFVPRLSGEEMAKEIGAVCYMECSAMDGTGIDELFFKAAQIAHQKSCTIF